MNTWLIAASAAAFATFVVHTWLGGREIAAPLLRGRELAKVPKLTLYYCWHMVTVLLLGMSAALLWAAAHANPALVAVMGALALAFMLLSLALALGSRTRLWHMPQWSFFLLIAAFCAVGLAGA